MIEPPVMREDTQILASIGNTNIVLTLNYITASPCGIWRQYPIPLVNGSVSRIYLHFECQLLFQLITQAFKLRANEELPRTPLQVGVNFLGIFTELRKPFTHYTINLLHKWSSWGLRDCSVEIMLPFHSKNPSNPSYP